MSDERQPTNRRRPLSLVATLLGMAVVVVLPGQAVAGEPTRQTFTQIGVRSTAPCPSGVLLQGLFDITRDVTTHYDAAGIPVRRLSVNRAEGSWTNAGTGAWLASEVVRQVHTDLITGEAFSTGSSSRTFLPGGGGVAIGAAGLQLFDASGQLVAHFGTDSDTERAQLCQALGA